MAGDRDAIQTRPSRITKVNQVPESILFHTRTLSIIGNIIRIALTKSVGDSPSFGDLAEVRDEQGGLQIAQVVKLDDEVASLQVFSGAQGLTTRAKIGNRKSGQKNSPIGLENGHQS